MNSLYPIITQELTSVLQMIDHHHPSQLSVFMPLVCISRMMDSDISSEQGGLCLRQVAHCCRVMGMLEPSFYKTPLYQRCQQMIQILGHHLQWYRSTITRWLRFSLGQI